MSERRSASAILRRDPLREIGLFGGLSDTTLDLLLEDLSVVNVEAGSFVLKEGESAREMFVVIGGELEVLKRSPSGSEARVAMLGPGDWVGEMSILDVMPRSASVRALAPSLMLVVSASDFDKLYRRDIQSYAMLVMNIARELSRRLRVADGIVANVAATVWDEYLGPRKKPALHE
ncbi:MAG: cyclic nucleotide-binding domain-containing protein [Deltaproteobacteria bacterium]|nr:cyclic nucleotide-binding domain-containing protein [Deltaproteobacteria bacterium]